jgi:hypothetical protein
MQALERFFDSRNRFYPIASLCSGALKFPQLLNFLKSSVALLLSFFHVQFSRYMRGLGSLYFVSTNVEIPCPLSVPPFPRESFKIRSVRITLSVLQIRALPSRLFRSGFLS